MNDTINFSDSWNGKLKCGCFTTFRLVSGKYKINKSYKIVLKGKFIGTATIKGMRITKLDKINEFVSFLDTGYEPETFKKIVRTMYKNKVANVDEADFYYILLRWDREPQLNFN